jgi:hypothetical protein
LGLAVAIIVGALLVSASGAATTKAQKVSKIDVSTRAAVIHYLHSIHVRAKGVVIQRGLRNYAGAHCPGRGWTCASTGHTVVQIAKRGGQNRYACSTAKCAVVQLGSAVRTLKAAGKLKPPPPPGNTASCIKTTGITQSCTINQPNATGTNTAIVWMVTPKLTGLTQSASYTASITQGPASATGSSNNNVACVTQAVSIDGSTTSTSGSITVTNDAHQSITIQQNSLTGSNTVQGSTNPSSGVYGCGTASSSLAQTETLTSKVTGKGSITQLQDTATGTPNVLLDIEQNQNTSGGFKNNALATATNAASFVQTSHMTAIANTPKGPVTQTQSSSDDNPPYSGIVAAINQDTTGVSSASATQIETQCQDAATSGQTTCDTNDADKPAYSVIQTQYGPEGIYHSTRPTQGRVPFVHKTPGDSAQTGNPASTDNSWAVTQSSTQDNDTNSGQKNTIAGGIASPGTGIVNQNALIQGSQTIDVQENGNGTILCPTGKNSCTKTLSAPVITHQPANPSLYGSGDAFTFKNADPTVTFLCSLDGAAYGPCTSVNTPTITGPPYPPRTGSETTSTLASGRHTFSVETVDPANLSGPKPASDTVTWWITPPDPTITSTAPPNPDFSGNSYTFTFTDLDNTVQYQCQMDNQTATACNTGTSPTYSDLAPGSHTFTVTAYGANDSGFTHPDTTPPTATWTILPLSVSAFESDGLTNDAAVGTDGSSAGWECQPGGPIALQVGTSADTDPYQTFGQVAITNAGGTPISMSEPSFATDNYASGSPRYVIDLSNGDLLNGLPPNPSLGNVGMVWQINYGWPPMSWSDVQTVEAGTTVVDAYVVADGSQLLLGDNPPNAAPDNISDLTFKGVDFNSDTCSAP